LTCRLWDLETRKCIAIGEGHTDAVGSIGISQKPSTYLSKKAFIVTGAMDKVLKKWPISSSLNAKNLSTVPSKLVSSDSVRAHDKDINTIAVSPNDSLIATGSQDKLIKLWNSSNLLSAVATLTGHRRGVWKVVFSPVD